MKKKYRRSYGSRRRRGSFGSSNWAPLVKLLACVLGIAALLAFVVVGTMTVLETVFKIDTPLKPDGIIAKIAKLVSDDDVLVVTPTPYVPPPPTPTPHPMDAYNAEQDENEVVLPVDMHYRFFGDPTVYGGKMLFAAGLIVDGNVNMSSLLTFEPEYNTFNVLPIKPRNQHFIYPCFNDEWLVYLDGKLKGGGDICAYNLDSGGEPVVIKTVYVGQPELRLDGHYLAWIERTGTTRDKLFVCDLETMETTVVAMFSDSGYGTSVPDMHEGTLIWASEDSSYYETSVIKHIEVSSSGIGLNDYVSNTYIHDPETNGKYFAWLDAHHSPETKLYISKIPSQGTQLEPKLIASGVVDFYLDNDFVAYSMDEVVYVYLFEAENSYRISPERELAQLLGASDGYVIWMDVTTRERDVMKYAKILTD